jgi:hypothetical protein
VIALYPFGRLHDRMRASTVGALSPFHPFGCQSTSGPEAPCPLNADTLNSNADTLNLNGDSLSSNGDSLNGETPR